MIERLRRQVESALSEHAPNAGHLLLALSGGGDSVALLRLLHGGPRRLAAAHLDHALRAESAEDARFVAGLCEALEVPLVAERADVRGVAAERGWNVEDAGRRLRYAFLARTAKRLGADAIVTAHTRDDQAETVLLQLLRGSAFPGGMAARRGRVVRPLLGATRAQLRDLLDGLDQPFLEDAGNADTTRDRAWVRHALLPALEARRPGVAERFARFARVQRDADHFLRSEAEGLFEGGALDTARLLAAAPALRRSAVAALLRRAEVAPSGARIEGALALAERTAPARLDLAPGATLRSAYGRLEVVGPPAPRPDEEAVRAVGALPADLPADLPVAWVADLLDRLPDLVLRGRRPGDTIRLAAGRRSLADLLVDRKVPREARDALRVLASGSTVLWVEGLGAAHGLGAAVEASSTPPEARWMRLALREAERAAEAGELPVGAVVVSADGRLLAAAHNRTEALADPSAHAEVLALRGAAAVAGDWRLPGATLYVTLEPCPMCYGAALQGHLGRLVYGASNPREGALGSVLDLRRGGWKRRPEVLGGVLAGPAADLLRAFFARRREG